MIGNKPKPSDQLVASAPAVRFATDEAAQTVLGSLRSTYDNAVTFANQQAALADACQADMDKWAAEIEERKAWIEERKAWIEERDLEKRAALQQAQRGRDAAKGAADTLAVLGAPVPPANGELSHDPDGAWSRVDAAHDALNASGGAR
ncbi:hypothetical protein [Sphaerimonospora thailandensis]|uniref:Uncharacterized protein n=1 Tax=Sphaerimonospora thailandensis TaxID=795644 RepID=A0A8J3RAC3_9ACTN|nr:hypothetical protein [Sphaerimonospora thailandensis]GIH70284.1 hypothetical protein Mth01_25370 [Sphaerimonospora thailandensis]